LRSSGMLCGVSRQLVTLTLEDGTGRMSRSVRNQYEVTLFNTPEGHKTGLHPRLKPKLIHTTHIRSPLNSTCHYTCHIVLQTVESALSVHSPSAKAKIQYPFVLQKRLQLRTALSPTTAVLINTAASRPVGRPAVSLFASKTNKQQSTMSLSSVMFIGA